MTPDGEEQYDSSPRKTGKGDRESMGDIASVFGLLSKWVGSLPVSAVLVSLAAILGGGVIAWFASSKAADGKKQGGAKSAAKVPATPPPPSLNRILQKDVTAFLGGLPARARRSLEGFQVVVLLGTESSGKSQIVERFAGVTVRRAEIGKAAQSAPSHARFTMGSDVLAIELSEEVCRAAAEEVAGGLRRVLGPFLRRRKPLVLVCMAVDAIERRDEDLADLASHLRAKVDIIAELRGEPVHTRFVVPDLDGGGALSALLRMMQWPFARTILPMSDPSEPALSALLREYIDVLPSALAAMPHEEVLGVVGALEVVPIAAERLALLAGTVLRAGGRRTPVTDGLYFVPKRGGPDPLVVPDAMRTVAPSPVLRHRVVAASLAALAGIVFCFRYGQEKARWTEALQFSGSYETRRAQSAEFRSIAMNYATGGTPFFFREGPAHIGCDFVASVRKSILVPALDAEVTKSLDNNEDDSPAIFYILALLYASHGSDLDSVISQHTADWAWITADNDTLSEFTIQSYLKLAAPNTDRGPFERVMRRLPGAQHLPMPFLRLRHFLELAKAQGATADPHAGATDFFAAATAFKDVPLYDYAYDYLDKIVQSSVFREQFQKDRTFLDAHSRAITLAAQLTAAYDPLTELQGHVRAILSAQWKAKNVTAPALLNLVAAMRPLLTDTDRDPPRKYTFSFDDAPVVYDVRTTQCLSSLRQVVLFMALDAFRKAAGPTAGGDLALFPKDGSDLDPILTGGAWPAGMTAAESIPRRYTRLYCEQYVQAPLNELAGFAKALGETPRFENDLDQTLTMVSTRYAGAYDAQVNRVYTSPTIAPSSAGAVRRIFDTLAGTFSPLRGFLTDLKQQTSLDTGTDPAAPSAALRSIVDHYAPLANVVGEGKGDDALVAYQDILRDVVAELDALATAMTSPGSAGAGAATEPASADAGNGAKTAPPTLGGIESTGRAAVLKWAAAAKLNDALTKPFLVPFDALRAASQRTQAASVQSYWHDWLKPALDADLLAKFPFSPLSGDDASPDDLVKWLHPKQGILFQQVLPFLEPAFIEEAPSQGGRRSFTSAGDVPLPDGLLRTIARLATVSGLLWDDQGNPSELCARVKPLPFAAAGTDRTPTLVRLSVGEQGVYYFNQQPQETLIKFPWTQPAPARVAVQIDDDMQPPMLERDGSWSLLHLLQSARQKGTSRSWTLDLENGKSTTVTFAVREDLTSAFQSGRGAVLGRALCEASSP